MAFTIIVINSAIKGLILLSFLSQSYFEFFNYYLMLYLVATKCSVTDIIIMHIVTKLANCLFNLNTQIRCIEYFIAHHLFSSVWI